MLKSKVLSKSKDREAKCSKSKDREAKCSKSKDREAKCSKSKDREAKCSKSKDKYLIVLKYLGARNQKDLKRDIQNL